MINTDKTKKELSVELEMLKQENAALKSKYEKVISERILSEEALTYEKNLLRSLMDNMPDNIYFKDFKSRFIRISRTMANLFGLKNPEQAYGKTDFDFFTEEHANLAFATELEIMKTGMSAVGLEEKETWPNGKESWVSTTKVPLLDNNGNIIGTFGISRDITEHKLALESRLASEIRYRRLFESAKDGILILDAETGKIVDVNPYLIEMLGYSKEQLIEKVIWDIGFFKDLVANQDKFLELQQKQYIRYEDLPLETADGRQFNVEIVSNVYTVNTQKVIQCNIRNITERKLAEKLIRASEEKFRLITENSADAIFIVDDFGRYVYVNTKAVNMLGYSKEEMLMFTIADISPKNRVEEYYQIFRQLLQEGHFFTELELVKKDGTILAADFNAVLLPNGFVYASCRDITERKRSDEELLRKNIFIQTVLDNLPMGIALNEIDKGRTIYVNKKFEEVYGWSKEEMTDVPNFFKKVYPEESYREKIIARVMDDVKSGDITRMHWENNIVTHKDGSKHIINSVNIPLFDQNLMVSTAIDITNRKIAEEELEKHRNNLEELVQLRTQEWNNANEELQIQIEREKEVELMLQQSLEKEKELSEMQSRFISTTSHEFRTPLTAVLSSTELLQRYSSKWDENKKNEHYNRIIESIEYLTKLIDDVLTISRTETGKITFNPESVDLFQLISECKKDNKSLLTEKHKLELNYIAEEKSFRLDRKLMKFILNNLLSNAAKYSPSGGNIRMTINQDQQQLIIKISDEGIGIPPEEIDKIFDSFYRSKNTGTIEGTGLGLAIVKRAIDLHNGVITVSSELNKGTTFNVKIPLIVA